MSDTERPAFEKQVVRLPDGRELTYYWFPEPPPPGDGAASDGAASGERRPAGNRGSPAKKER